MARTHFWFWSSAVFLAFLALYFLQDILTPFLAGAALAYLLDPLVDRLEQRKIRRNIAAAIVLVGFLLLVTGFFLLLAPIIVFQLQALLELSPMVVESIQDIIAYLITKWPFSQIFDQQSTDIFSDFLQNEQIKRQISDLSHVPFAQILANIAAFLRFISLSLLTIIIGFYLLVDWDTLISRIDSWLPRPYQPILRKIACEINLSLAGFVRGQLGVCFILALFYMVALSLVGLRSALAIGAIAGGLSFIPFVGSLIGMFLSVSMAVLQFYPNYGMIFLVAGIFLFGQFMEGNILSPKIIGAATRLHPVAVIFALVALGSFLGFTGILIAVPLAAVLGVLVRFLLQAYLQSPFYRAALEGTGEIEASRFDLANSDAEETKAAPRKQPPPVKS